MTGGNSYPYFVYGPDLQHISDPDVLAVTLAVKGDKPIFDATIEHVDLSERLDPQQFPTDQDLINAFLAKNLGPIKGGTFLTNRAFPVGFVRMKPESDKRIFRLTTVARNGAFEQVTTLRKGKSGRWYMAKVKVTKRSRKGKRKKC